ncbi:hypothetical protein [Fulvivirga ligni]|uniref:hypothetical protein n=1 Tax=Fulvivirga ligni TaxID=2904246 RepID=UPI001F40CBAB|nr:hypothetical protein [Fulvivirga ligni]UII20959.1 hypothetical protein LVD16_24245 [Fulvivirga ligni]
MNTFGYKLKLYSKKLKSGRCQIKFVVSAEDKARWHGYMLADLGSTLREVVTQIEEEVRYIEAKDVYYHTHLYNLASPVKRREKSIVVFNN